MAKDKPTKRAKSASGESVPASGLSLPELRGKIDQIDLELVRLMNERAAIAHAIGQLKQRAGMQAYAPAREEEVLRRVAQQNRGPLEDRSLRAVFRELISGSRALEKELRVAYLGPVYSFSYLASVHRFGQSVELVPVGSIAAVFEEVHGKQADFGVVPIENSTDGGIADTLEMFTRVPVRICAEVQLRIHHALLGKENRDQIVEVYSKPQALSQCRNWLAKHLPGARTVEVTSTTTAAQLAAEKPGAAAIASMQAGVHYGLNVLAADIEDNPGNRTRFAVIGDATGGRTGHDKCSLMMEVAHQPGALANALQLFKRSKLNLTWIESFPIQRPEGGYMFFLELQGHESDIRVKKAIAMLRKRAVRLEVLGSYAELPAVD